MQRKTSQRAAIEQVLLDAGRPLGLEEILRFGRERVESLNQATIYRNLKLLLDQGVARPGHTIRSWARCTNTPARSITIISTAGPATGFSICRAAR